MGKPFYSIIFFDSLGLVEGDTKRPCQIVGEVVTADLEDMGADERPTSEEGEAGGAGAAVDNHDPFGTFLAGGDGNAAGER